MSQLDSNPAPSYKYDAQIDFRSAAAIVATWRDSFVDIRLPYRAGSDDIMAKGGRLLSLTMVDPWTARITFEHSHDLIPWKAFMSAELQRTLTYRVGPVAHYRHVIPSDHKRDRLYEFIQAMSADGKALFHILSPESTKLFLTPLELTEEQKLKNAQIGKVCAEIGRIHRANNPDSF